MQRCLASMVSLVVLSMSACGARVVPVVPEGGHDLGTSSALSDPSFEVVARTGGIHDPLPVNGASVVYADLEQALGHAVLRSVRPIHDHILTVELVAAEATYDHGRIAISLVARVTLRARLGNAFEAQTQIVCRDAALGPPEAGAAVVYSCMTGLGRDVGGWLSGLGPAAQ